MWKDASVCHVYPIGRTTSEEGADCRRGGGGGGRLVVLLYHQTMLLVMLQVVPNWIGLNTNFLHTYITEQVDAAVVCGCGGVTRSVNRLA